MNLNYFDTSSLAIAVSNVGTSIPAACTSKRGNPSCVRVIVVGNTLLVTLQYAPLTFNTRRI